MKNNKIKKILVISNFFALILTLVINGLANVIPLNGKTTGEISDSYPNLFVPAGITFSIWGIIYLMLILFVLYQVVSIFSQKIDADRKSVV